MPFGTPLTFVPNQVLTAEILNTEVRDKVNYLYNRPYSVKTATGASNITINTGVTFVPFNDTAYRLEVESSGRPIELSMLISGSQSGTINTALDFLYVNNNTFVSSGTATPLPLGIGWTRYIDINDVRQIWAYAIFIPPSAGIHAFLPRINASGASTFTWRITNTINTFIAKEI
jgi:hypothetical protein